MCNMNKIFHDIKDESINAKTLWIRPSSMSQRAYRIISKIQIDTILDVTNNDGQAHGHRGQKAVTKSRGY
jgi:hypothetical protein